MNLRFRHTVIGGGFAFYDLIWKGICIEQVRVPFADKDEFEDELAGHLEREIPASVGESILSKIEEVDSNYLSKSAAELLKDAGGILTQIESGADALDWPAALTHLEAMIEEAEATIAASGGEIDAEQLLRMELLPLKHRYDQGERTLALYEGMATKK